MRRVSFQNQQTNIILGNWKIVAENWRAFIGKKQKTFELKTTDLNKWIEDDEL